ncbi:MAG: hypothetical protein GY898_32275 [Proteobacteria bacterium]|nr:hypothetical protein [Pseudomonadota bacterium]
MTTPEPDLDELIDRAKPSLLVSLAAGVMALHGVLAIATGLQGGVVTMGGSGWVTWIPPILLGAAALNIAGAYAMAKFVRRVGWMAPFVAGFLALLSGAWFLIAAFGHVLSPGALINAMFALPSIALVLIAQPSWHRCAQARKKLAGELGDGAGSGGGGGGLVAVGVTLILVIGGGVAVMQGLSVGDPLTLGIVRRGSVDEAADFFLASEIATNLERAGLTLVIVPDPIPSDAPLEAALRAAREERAGHALILDLSSQQMREGLVPGNQLYLVTMSAEVASTRPGSEAVSFAALEYAYESTSPSAAIRQTSEQWATALNPWTLDALFAQESFAPVLAYEVSSGKLGQARQLSQLQRGVGARHEQEQEWAAYCTDEAARLATLGETEPGVTCLEGACRAWFAAGVAEDGRVVVQEYTREPVFKIPPSVKPDWTEPPERLLLVDPEDPSTIKTLFEANNLYDLAKVDVDGRFAIVEAFGADSIEGLVQLDLIDDRVSKVGLLARRQRTRWFQPGIGGGPTAVNVRNVGTGLLWPDRGVDIPNLDRVRWTRTPAGPRLLGQTGPEVRLYDEAGTPTGRLELEGRLKAVEPDGDSLLILDEAPGGCRLIEADGRTLRRKRVTAMPICLGGAQRLDDGRWVGVAPLSADGDVPGDDEVVLWDPAAEMLLPLTANGRNEEVVHPTLDGKRVVFNRRLNGWPQQFDTKVYRRQICWTDLP